MTSDLINFKQQMKKFLFYVVSFLVITTMVVLIALFASVNKNEQTSPVSSNALVFTNPILNAEIIKNYSATELQWNETLKQWEAHKAVDFSATENTKVYAALGGVVEAVTTNSLLGTQITIKHDGGLKTVYGMLKKEVAVNVGDFVQTGDQIGIVETATGVEEKDGAHLHFEIWKDGSKVDPNAYLNLEGK